MSRQQYVHWTPFPNPVSPDWRDEHFQNFNLPCARQTGRPIVVANGCFDILHPGHVDLLEFASRQAENACVLVALNGDDSVKRLKGDHRPYFPWHERAKMLAAIRFVDAVVGFTEDTPERLLELVRPEVLVKGSDHVGSEPAGSRWSRKVAFAPLWSAYHTSEVARLVAGAG
jgi:rfaE bifunctional protein nucleotidyltransferase chain/domain